jgi:hypothetical protein
MWLGHRILLIFLLLWRCELHSRLSSPEFGWAEASKNLTVHPVHVSVPWFHVMQIFKFSESVRSKSINHSRANGVDYNIAVLLLVDNAPCSCFIPPIRTRQVSARDQQVGRAMQRCIFGASAWAKFCWVSSEGLPAIIVTQLITDSRISLNFYLRYRNFLSQSRPSLDGLNTPSKLNTFPTLASSNLTPVLPRRHTHTCVPFSGALAIPWRLTELAGIKEQPKP